MGLLAEQLNDAGTSDSVRPNCATLIIVET